MNAGLLEIGGPFLVQPAVFRKEIRIVPETRPSGRDRLAGNLENYAARSEFLGLSWIVV